MINFRGLSIINAIVSFLLFFTLFLAPQLIFVLFEVEGNTSASFLARRAGLLFLGYALITYFARNAEHSNIRQAIALGMGSAWLSLAVLGALELIRGFVGFGILLAMVAELLLAFAYLSVWFTNRSKGLGT